MDFSLEEGANKKSTLSDLQLLGWGWGARKHEKVPEGVERGWPRGKPAEALGWMQKSCSLEHSWRATKMEWTLGRGGAHL